MPENVTGRHKIHRLPAQALIKPWTFIPELIISKYFHKVFNQIIRKFKRNRLMVVKKEGSNGLSNGYLFQFGPAYPD